MVLYLALFILVDVLIMGACMLALLWTPDEARKSRLKSIVLITWIFGLIGACSSLIALIGAVAS